MNSITNSVKSLALIAIFAAFALGLSATTVLAFGESGGSGSGSGSDSGCCNIPPSNPPSNPPEDDDSNDYNPPAYCSYLRADKTTVNNGGENVTLSWSTTNAQSVSIDNGIGNVAKSGSKTVFVDSNTTYNLTAVGTHGNDNCAVAIKVQEVEKLAECKYLNANKTSVVSGGETVTLSWATLNGKSASLNNGIGNVSLNSTGYNVFVDSDRTYILTVTGTNGSDDCAVTITVKTTEQKAPRCDYFRIVGDSNVNDGDRVYVEWETTNADQVTITPSVGSVAADGSTYITVSGDQTYTLRARNIQSGQDTTCTVTVYVDEDEDEDDDEPAPKCDLEVSKKHVNRGEQVTLSWDTSRADSVRIKDDRGNTIFDTSDYRSSERKKYLDGEIDVVINRTTEFTLNARGDGGSKNCKVEVTTEDIDIYEKRDQGYVIALTQVPYTGFEAGPFLTFLFYAVLTLWALFIAYVLVIKKGSILGFSLYGRGAASAADADNRKKVEALVAKYSGQNWK